jgi:YVTN family beta-propeller protein
MDMTPDGRLLVTTNGVTNDVSVIDVASRTVLRSIPVGRFPWGVAVRP